MRLTRFGWCSVFALPLALVGCSGAFGTGQPGGDDAGDGDGSSENPPIQGVGVQDAGHDGTTTDAHLAAETGAADEASTGGPEGGTVVEAGDEGPGPGCPTGDIECTGTCVPSDVHNCGTCGHDCTNLAHVGGATTCTAAGACSFPESACATGWSSCDSNPDNGCETDITKPAACGSCSSVCPSTAPVCSSGTCVSGCSATQALCGGSCVDTTSNASDCGSCGNTCTTSVGSAQPTCSASKCGFTCNATFTGCPTAAPTSCVDEQHDPVNCGACGKTCPGPTTGQTTGQPACAAGVCSLSCDTGLTACPSAPAIPTVCTDTTTDLNNCGSCSDACTTAVANAHATCATSKCGFACNPGFLLCNGNSCLPGPLPNSLFVSPGGTGSACTQAAPCGSIDTAIGLATSGGKSTIYLDEGPFAEQVMLANPASPGTTITLQGGWTYSSATGIWTTCNATNATIETSAAASVIQVVSGTWTLDKVNVANNTTAAPGQTLYGVFASGGGFTLTNGAITVNKGGDGAPGAAATGTGGTGTAGGCTTGGTGSPGAVGQYGSSAYDASGYFTTAPLGGGTGDIGTVGAAGAAGSCLGCDQKSCSFDTVDNICACGTEACGSDGHGGCGGQGGPGGGAASAGGSSIGVFAWGASVSIQAPITVGNGGHGGDGGAGGGGGAGAAGAAGFSVTGYSCNRVGTTTTCNAGSPTSKAAGGAAGGNGGTGGTGGQGGGGNGGDSYCYYQGAGATVVAGGPCTPSSGGVGGNQGTSNPAPSGHQGHVP